MGSKKITDVGQHLPFAKKDLAKTKEINTKPGQPPRKQAVTLKNLWPEPNWLDLFNRGVSKEILTNVYGIYHSLAKKPHTLYGYSFAGVQVSIEMWEEAYIDAIKFIKSACENSADKDDIDMIIDNFSRRFKKDGANTHFTYAAGRRTAKTFFHPLGNETAESNFKKLLMHVDFPRTVNPKKIALFPIKFTRTSNKEKIYILAKPNLKSYSYRGTINGADNEFKTYQSAVEALLEYYGDQITNKPAAKPVDQVETPVYNPTKPKFDVHSNIQPDERTAPDLMNMFGFRGVQFGNYLPQNERQIYINNTYSSLEILARVLSIPNKWVGGGKLGIAFGARGSGNAAAHYEFDLHVVNLTRFNGPGSIAHELFHAFDGRLSIKSGLSDQLLSESLYSRRFYFDTNSLSSSDKLRFEAFRRIVKACCAPSEYLSNAKRIGAQKNGRKYWDTPCELCARAFEAYVQDKVAHVNVSARWLVNGTTEKDYPLNGMHPYPTGEDRKRLNLVFAKNLPILFAN